MRKGQKVRIMSSGKIGVIADSEFFYWNYKKHVRYEVKVEGQKNTCWYPKEALTTDLVERVKVVISGEAGTLNLDFEFVQEKCSVTLSGNPDNLCVHKGKHVALATLLLERLSSLKV